MAMSACFRHQHSRVQFLGGSCFARDTPNDSHRDEKLGFLGATLSWSSIKIKLGFLGATLSWSSIKVLYLTIMCVQRHDAYNKKLVQNMTKLETSDYLHKRGSDPVQ